MKSIKANIIVITFSAILIILLNFLNGCNSGRGPQDAPALNLNGKFLIFAETISTSDYLENETDELNQNIYMRIGHYYFHPTGNQVRLRYFIFNGRHNKKPSPHATIYRPDRPDLPEGFCQKNGNPASEEFAGRKFQRPVYSDFIDITGTWEAEDNLVRTTFSNTTHEWIQDKNDSSLFRTNKPFYNATDGSYIIDGFTYYNNVGFAYLTDSYTVADINISNNHLHDRYVGEYYHHNAYQTFFSGWEYKAEAQLNPYIFTVEAPHLLALWDTTNSCNRKNDTCMVENILLLNDAPHSNLIIYSDFGKDFSKNECFDDFGHTQFMWGIWDSGKISKILFIEYSYQFEGKPMFTVGRYAVLN